MANRKLGPVEGDLCWFCKMPSDDQSWMGLGILKSTRQPVFDGRYILYHECCAVYSCGAEDTPANGMSDETVMKFYRHGEKAAGIGLKCQLCGKRGATTGCFYGPCQQFYHFPCARARASQGHLAFSLDGKRLACMEHTPLLPLPHEDDFMGMWMEGIGSWNGMMMEQARETWLPHYQHYHGQFLTRWAPLINMMPAAELRAMQDMVKGSRKSNNARTGKVKEDPDYKVKGGSAHKIRRSVKDRQGGGSSGGGGGGGGAAAAGRPSSSSGAAVGSKRPRQHQSNPSEQQQGWLGVPGDVAAAAAAAAERGPQGYGVAGGHQATTSRSSFLEQHESGELFSPNSARSRQQQFPRSGHMPSADLKGQREFLLPQQQDQQQQQQQQQQQHYQLQQQQRLVPDWQDTDMRAGPAFTSMQSGPAAHTPGREALRQLLQVAGNELQEQPGGLVGNPLPAKPELNCQLLLAAAGFDTSAESVPDWPGQRASSAGQYLNRQQDWDAGLQQQQQHRQPLGSMLVAADPGFAGGQGPPFTNAAAPGGLAALARTLGGGRVGGAAAGAVSGGRVALGRSVSGASSADSAPNGGQAGQLHRRNTVDRDQQLGVSCVSGPGLGAGQFRYTTGVLVGPGGPEQPGKKRKLLDLNTYARTGRKQLSEGMVKLENSLPQQQPPPQQQQQQQQEQRQFTPPPAGPMTDADMLQKIAAAMKAVTEAEGPDQAEALATAAAMIAAAAAAQAQNGRAALTGLAGGVPSSPLSPVMAAGPSQGLGVEGPRSNPELGTRAGLQGQQFQQIQGLKQEPQEDVQHEVLDLLRMHFGAQ